VAGSAPLLDMLAPSGPVYQAGTLSGNPAAATAGLATLRLLDADAYATLDAVADRVTALAASALDAAAVPHVINRAGNLFSVFFTADPVVDIQSARTQDTKAFARFFHAALDAGLWLPPSAFEAWFVSTSHGEEELARIATALEAGASAARTGAVDQ